MHVDSVLVLWHFCLLGHFLLTTPVGQTVQFVAVPSRCDECSLYAHTDDEPEIITQHKLITCNCHFRTFSLGSPSLFTHPLVLFTHSSIYKDQFAHPFQLTNRILYKQKNGGSSEFTASSATGLHEAP